MQGEVDDIWVTRKGARIENCIFTALVNKFNRYTLLFARLKEFYDNKSVSTRMLSLFIKQSVEFFDKIKRVHLCAAGKNAKV